MFLVVFFWEHWKHYDTCNNCRDYFEVINVYYNWELVNYVIMYIFLLIELFFRFRSLDGNIKPIIDRSISSILTDFKKGDVLNYSTILFLCVCYYLFYFCELRLVTRSRLSFFYWKRGTAVAVPFKFEHILHLRNLYGPPLFKILVLKAY